MPDAARLGGAALAAAVAGLAALRRGRARPLHPQGATVVGRLELAGTEAETPDDDGLALLRVSRGAGLPAALPDVQGVALRWWHDGRPQDLLLSSTGRGRWSRSVLAPRRTVRGAYGTVMPFRTDAGPRVVTAEVAGAPGARLVVAFDVAEPAGPARPWGRFVEVAPAPEADPALRFDPVLHCPRPWSTYPWAAALRLPAYRTARRRAARPT